MRIMRGVLAILALVLLSAAPAFATGRAAAPAFAGDRDQLVQVGLTEKVVQLVADAEGTCALTEAGTVYCWSADYPSPYPASRGPLVLVTIGALLVAGGTTVLALTRK